MKKRQLLFISVFISVISWFGFHGIAFSDEHEYARIAYQISQNTFQNTGHHFDNRFGLTLPTAGLIRITGLSSDWIYTIWSLLSFLGLIWLLFWLFNKNNEHKYSNWVLLFLAINPVFLYLSSDVAPDLVMTMWIYLSFISLWLYRKIIKPTNFKILSYSFLFSIGLFCAFTTKLTMLFCLPFFGILCLLELRIGANKLFWLSAFTFSLLFLLAYFYLYEYFMGDAFFRFRGIEAHHGTEQKVVLWNYANRPLKDYLLRLTVYPIGFFLNSPSFSLFGIPALLFFKSFKLHRNHKIEHYSFLFILTTGFCFWFGTTSFKQYNPVILVDRMLLPLIPALIIVGISILKQPRLYLFPFRKQFQIILLTAFLLCLGGLIYFRFEYLGFLVAMLMILFLWHLLRTEETAYFSSFMLVGFLFISINGIQLMKKKDKTSYFSEKEQFNEIAKKGSATIFTDPKTVEMFSIYFDFKVPRQLQVFPFHAYDQNRKRDTDELFIHRNFQRIEDQLEYHDYLVNDSIFLRKNSDLIMRNDFFELRKPRK